MSCMSCMEFIVDLLTVLVHLDPEGANERERESIWGEKYSKSPPTPSYYSHCDIVLTLHQSVQSFNPECEFTAGYIPVVVTHIHCFACIYHCEFFLLQKLHVLQYGDMIFIQHKLYILSQNHKPSHHRKRFELLHFHTKKNPHQCTASTWMMRWEPYCARTPTPAYWWREYKQIYFNNKIFIFNYKVSHNIYFRLSLKQLQ